MTNPPTISLNRDQLAALLAHHADALAAHLRTEPARDNWIAAERLDVHATELTADKETPTVAELLDSMMTFPLEQPAEETHVVADDSDDPEHVDDCPGCAPAAAGESGSTR